MFSPIHPSSPSLQPSIQPHIMERTLRAHGTERALERTLERTLRAHGTERALERTLWARGTERAVVRTLWAHGTERAFGASLEMQAARTDLMGGSSSLRTSPGIPRCAAASSAATGDTAVSSAATGGTAVSSPTILAGECAKNSSNSSKCQVVLPPHPTPSEGLIKGTVEEVLEGRLIVP